LITTPEIVQGLAGAIRIIRFDARAGDWFDGSLAAARRSFWGFVLVFPLFVMVELLPLPEGPVAPREFDPGLTLLSFVIAVTAYPLAAWHMTRAFGLAAGYPRYLTAYNWFTVVEAAAFAPLYALISLGGWDFTTLVAVYYAERVLCAVYAVFIARTVLRAELGQAMILAVVDFMISQSLGQLMAAIRMGAAA